MEDQEANEREARQRDSSLVPTVVLNAEQRSHRILQSQILVRNVKSVSATLSGCIMKIHEYQGKEILRSTAFRCRRGEVAFAATRCAPSHSGSAPASRW
jgi:hypothetical protein